jgi:hypothetical protein
MQTTMITQDGQMGRAWQAPGANFDQIHEITSVRHIFTSRGLPATRPFLVSMVMMASKNFLTATLNIFPYAYA